MANASKEKLSLASPLIKKAVKIEADGARATYKGIFNKSVLFLALAIAGAILAFVIHFIPMGTVVEEEGVTLHSVELILAIISCGIFLIFPFIAVFARKTTAVVGSICYVAIGYTIGFLSCVIDGYGAIAFAALVITLAIVATMLALFVTGVIKVTSKFKTVLYSSIGAMILASIILIICYFIPVFRPIYEFFAENLAMSILISVFGLILACGFLMIDFSTAKDAVESGVSEKAEWQIAFSLVFTIVWIYFKVLEILAYVKDGK